jgi:Ca2+-binding RTX toxin-like protein
MLSTLIDSNGKVVTDGNGKPILNLEVATAGSAKAIYHVADNGASLTAPNGAQALLNALTPIGNAIQTYAPPLIDALSLIKAIQSGDPLPVTVSGLRLANALNTTNGVPGSYTLSGAANVGSGLLSLMSLDAALKRGDTLGAVTAGAQTLSFGAKAYLDFAQANNVVSGVETATDIGNFLNGTPGNIGVLPALNLVNSIANGDGVGAAISTLQIANSMGLMTVPFIGEIAMAYAVFNMVTSLFGGSDAPPEAWGSASATWSGFNAVANATGAYGGLESATQTYNGVLSYLDQLAAQEQAANPGSPIGIVANRLPSLSYRNYTGYGITDIDPLTGEQRNPGTLYDLTGRPYNAPAGSVQASQSLSERMIRVALERGAVAPLWEVQTAALQTLMGDPMAGLTEEERAGRAGLLAPQPAAGATSQTFRAVALDLNGDGVQTTGAARTVAFDVDDSGYLKNTAWLNNNDGFLFLDRNLNGQIDAGSELFSNSAVALGERGLAGMRWIDSNYDGSLSPLDPVWNELKVWQDANGNGTAEAGETQTLAQLGITSLNYAMGTFERNGQLSQLASPDLAADTEGTRTHVVPEGIIIQTSNGHTSLLATRIDDKSAIEANRDGVTGYEDTELIISAADLLANDTLAGLSGNNLSITGVSGFTHGSGFLDGNGFVHYTPDANYFGAAQFNYSIKAVTGQTAAATVDLTLQNVNDAPTATLDQHLKPIYGYDYGRLRGGVRPIVRTHYAPYITYDYSDDWYAQTVHDTIIGYGDPDPNEATILVTDPDDPAGSFTFEVSAQAQKGEGTVDANGNIGYINWVGPNMLGTDPVMVPGPRDTETATYPTESDPFTVRVTDPHGASTTVSVNTQHEGDYNPNLGSGGSGGKPISVDLDGNGFNFTNVDDSNVFFDINGDGWKHRMAWVAPGDGLLAFDADGNGLIDNGSEISFAGYQPDAQTDLEGLRAFDTNNDGLFSALDAQWGKFGVWQDADQDGITDAGEFKSLSELGIASVNLTSNGQFSVINGQTVHGIGQINKTDGSTLNIADVTLQYSDEVQVTNNADGTVSVAVKPPFASGETVTGTPDKDLLLGNNGNTIINALEGDDVVFSDIGNDVIDAGAGNDIVYAGGGNDLAIGGTGDDVVFAGLGNDVVLGGDGHDALFGEGGNDAIFGGNGNDLVSGGDGNNVLSGDAGDDQVYGGTGNDALFGGTGNDELAGMEGYDRLDGGAGNDLLDGGAQDDTLFGGAGDDILIGGAGNDALDGGTGNDTYLFGRGAGQDTINDTDATAGNIDTVKMAADVSSSDVTVTREGDNLCLSIKGTTDKLTLAGWFAGDANKIEEVAFADGMVWNTAVLEALADIMSSGNTLNKVLVGDGGDNALAGGEGNDVLFGNGGNDVLDGGSGADTMLGGAGNDTYVVDNTGDRVLETINGGIDTVISGIGYALGDTLENLTLTGTANIDGTGNALDNLVTGNSGNNILAGMAGNDTLDGGQGADTLLGGTGNDTYIVDNAGDLVIENLNEGNDTVRAGIGYTLTGNVENLTLTGTADINGIGNALNNVIAGNSGNNRIDGGLGADAMAGGAGNDTYVVDEAGDVVAESANAGIDTVESGISYTLGDNVENLALTGADALNGTGNAQDNAITGNAANNVLDGAAGADTMLGGAGDDTYIVDNAADVVVENHNEGMDIVFSSVSYGLSPNVENLTLTGTANINGTGNALDNVIVGNDAANILSGLDGNDILIANGGNDRLDGGLGADTMLGGAGDDTYVVDNIGDLVIENFNAGTDTVESSITYTLTDNVENLILTGADAINGTGNELDNVIVGNNAANILSGLDGNDTLIANGGNDLLDGGLGADTMLGGSGDDTYVVESSGDLVIEEADSGLDTVESSITYTLTNNVENLILTGTDAISGTGNELDNLIVGNDAANTLSGLDGNDTLMANGGNDRLDGGLGADTMLGGAGDDTYVVESSGDLVIEAVNSGIDTVESGITYTLTDNVENLILTGPSTGSGQAAVSIDGTGNALDNLITGNSGNNRIDGGLGADAMLGGAGDDTYVVDNIGDQVIEDLNAGTDTVESSISYTLTDNVENLILTGADAINGTGNELDNVIVGNEAANILSGLDGNDTLIANGGNDRLDGGLGADTMLGGAGDDTYVVDNIGDLVIEDINAGIDTVESGITYTLTDNVENLILTGADAINGTGNVLDNVIVGNDAANILSGLDGNDTLMANGGNDWLDGGLGADTMLGGAGDDTYVVESSGDLVIEEADSGLDTVESGITYTLTDNVENLILTGTEAIDGTGNELDNLIVGNDAANTLSGLDGNDTLMANGGNDRLDGGLGADTMLGGAGDDTYVVESSGDLVIEAVNSGIDTVESGITYTLTDNVENLILTGPSTGSGQAAVSIDGTGNALDNLITGNSGNNRIDGGLGADAMLGGAGDDTYVVDNIGDQVIEDLNAGTDTVESSISYTLTDNVENLILTGADAINGTGNELDNVIVGNEAANILSGLDGNDTLIANGGNDRLDGGLGADTMLGGAGDDTYVVDNIGDLVIEDINAGIDTVESGITYTLTDNVENLILTGADAINGTGNVLDNVIVGNDAANILSGLDGNDTLIANGGNDLLDGGLGADTMLGGLGDDTYIVDNPSAGSGQAQGDLVVEDLGAGTDQVFSSISYTLTDNVENLTLTGTADPSTGSGQDINGTGNVLDNIIIGNSGNNTLSGLDGNDTLIGEAGNDLLDGGLGADTMLGGVGDDTYVVDNVGDLVVEDLGAGTDQVFSSISYTLTDNVENLTLTGTADPSTGSGQDINGTGNALDNIIVGNDAANTLSGLDGNDTLIANAGNDLLDGGLGTDIMLGGTGDDTYVVDNIGDLVTEDLNAGIDHVLSSITYTLADNVENLTLTGTADINGTGNELDNVLIGNSGNNLLIGLGGNDVLDGGLGADVMIGGIGNDTYVVDNVGDRVVEAGDDDEHGGDEHDDDDEKCVLPEYPAGGIDTVRSSITYTLGKHVENLVLTGSEAINGTGNDLDNILIGNTAANVLKGKDGNDTLIGNGGMDTLIGGEGDDTYVIGDAQSVLVEERKEGIDTVVSSVSYVLKNNFENLTLTGDQSLYAIGNDLDNVLTGNEGNNTLSAGDGNDTLDGGRGIDTLIGGEGDDLYLVDNAGDSVIESRNDGKDTVCSTVSYTLADNVENLTLAGTADINGTGNALDNVITGNGGANVLFGLGGNDTLQGNAAGDILQGGDGNDILRDNGGNNLLDGGRGTDSLSGNAGNELFAGGTGNDVIRTGDGADVILFNRGDGRDAVYGGIGTDNTLSLGGNIRYKDIALSKVDDDLILEVGDSDQITFKDWYETDTNYKSVLNLQVVTEAMAGFDAGSSDPLLNQSVQQFDFTAIVNAFDQARGNKSGEGSFRHWSVMNTLLDAHLAANDAAAIGGDLAYQYGKNGTLAGISQTAAQTIIGATQFGNQAQAIGQLPTIGSEVARLG